MKKKELARRLGVLESQMSKVLQLINIPDDGKLKGEIGPFEYNGYNYYVAPASTRVLRKWGITGSDTSLPNVPWIDTSTPGKDPNPGDYNTDVLTSNIYSGKTDNYGILGCPAAVYCRSLGDDWHLPNIKELDNVIYANRNAIDVVDTTVGTTLTDIGSSWVWSSTVFSSYHAYVQRMSDGYIYGGTKDYGLWVIAVRREPID